MKHLESRRQLSETAKELYREKLITATGGNLSLRLPDQEGFLITPSGAFKGGLSPESMIALDDRGRPINESSGTPSIETSLHLQVYLLRPQAGAVIHTHAPGAIVAGLYNMKIPSLTVEMIRFRELPLVPYYLPGSSELASATAAALKKHPSARAVLLQNHGLVTIGESLREAANITMALEEACRISILCRLLGGEPKEISAENCLLATKLFNL